jgi:hypothetical protein
MTEPKADTNHHSNGQHQHYPGCYSAVLHGRLNQSTKTGISSKENASDAGKTGAGQNLASSHDFRLIRSRIDRHYTSILTCVCKLESAAFELAARFIYLSPTLG